MAAPKKSVNPRIKSDLLRQAKSSRRHEWLLENQAALVEYNGKIETRGVFSDSLRRF